MDLYGSGLATIADRRYAAQPAPTGVGGGAASLLGCAEPDVAAWPAATVACACAWERSVATWAWISAG